MLVSGFRITGAHLIRQLRYIQNAQAIQHKYGSLDESQISSAQAVRLVAYLLLNDTRKVPQNELTNALWPNSEVDAPAKQVRNVVHRTRAILEPIFPDDLVSSDRAGNYFINPNITVITDASVFESFCRLAQQPAATFKEKLVYLRQATEIYQNDFLPQYTGDTWLDNQRTFYRLAYLKAVLTLLPMYYQMEKYSEMLSLSSAALLYEPDSGDILRQLDEPASGMCRRGKAALIPAQHNTIPRIAEG